MVHSIAANTNFPVVVCWHRTNAPGIRYEAEVLVVGPGAVYFSFRSGGIGSCVEDQTPISVGVTDPMPAGAYPSYHAHISVKGYLSTGSEFSVEGEDDNAFGVR
jgi:hypothetical protein